MNHSEMRPLKAQCGHCGRELRLGISVSPDAMMSMSGNSVTCGACGHTTSLPDIAIHGIAEHGLMIVRTLDTPAEAVQALINALQKAKSEQDLQTVRENAAFAPWRDWIPKNPRTVMVYVTILVGISTVLQHCHPKDARTADVINHAEKGGIQIIHIHQDNRARH